jgi:putative transposase
MKSNIQPLLTETFYHIYNRGINGETIFKSSDNYLYFLNKYAHFISPVAETYSYCLLKNHFHFLIKTRSEEDIQKVFREKAKIGSSLISLQFSHLFNGYTQAINKKHSRTGSLFEHPFRRKEIADEEYLRRVTFYIHFNAEKHKLCADFREYRFSSYKAFLSNKKTNLKKEEVLKWFENENGLIDFHWDLKNLNNDYMAFD